MRQRRGVGEPAVVPPGRGQPEVVVGGGGQPGPGQRLVDVGVVGVEVGQRDGPGDQGLHRRVDRAAPPGAGDPVPQPHPEQQQPALHQGVRERSRQVRGTGGRGSGVNRRGTFTSSRCTCRYPLFAALRRAIRVPVIAASSSSAVRIGPPGSSPVTSSGASATGASGTDRYSHTDPSVPCTRPSRFRARTVVGQSGSAAPRVGTRRGPVAGSEPLRRRCHPAGPWSGGGRHPGHARWRAGSRRVRGDGVAVRDQCRSGARAAPGDDPGCGGVGAGDQHVEGDRRRSGGSDCRRPVPASVGAAGAQVEVQLHPHHRRSPGPARCSAPTVVVAVGDAGQRQVGARRGPGRRR